MALNSDASLRRLKGPGRPAPAPGRAGRDPIRACLRRLRHDLRRAQRRAHPAGPEARRPRQGLGLLRRRPSPSGTIVLGYGGRIAIAGGPKIRSTSEVIPRILHRLGAKQHRRESALSERFLIVRTSSLGDIVHALPALAALRKHQPEAEIRWVVGDKGRAILDWVEGLDGIVVTGSPGWRRALRGRDQISLDFQGLLKSGLIGRLSGAERRIGFHRDNLREPAARCLLHRTGRAIPRDRARHPQEHPSSRPSLGINETEIASPCAFPTPPGMRPASVLRGLGWDGAGPNRPLQRRSRLADQALVPRALARNDRRRRPARSIFPVLLWGIARREGDRRRSRRDPGRSASRRSSRS